MSWHPVLNGMTSTSPMRILTLVLLPWCLCSAFDIFDPVTNLRSLIRATASLDPEVNTIGYGNGTVFVRIPGHSVQKIFYFEGFNIVRKKAVDAGFESLAREIFVYRDLVTGEILNIWMNPFTDIPNEVFTVANDPVDVLQEYGNPPSTILIKPELVGFNYDVFAKRPNVLDPARYPKYSAGPFYEGAELFEFYANLKELATSNSSSVKMVGSWYRKGQFLPWMEMGETPGCLFYHQTFWKLVNGVNDIAADILDLVHDKYPGFLTAPTSFSNESETSWDVFKQVIDGRRKGGQPDIIFPLLNISEFLAIRHNALDPRIIDAAQRTRKVTAYFNGSVYSEIPSNTSVQLFNVEGTISVRLISVESSHYNIYTNIRGQYVDQGTGLPLTTFKNPITGDTLEVPPFHYIGLEEVDKVSAFSYPLPGLHLLAVLFDQHHTRTHRLVEDWAMNMVNVFIHEDELNSDRPYFFGTWVKFSSWLPWLRLNSVPGEMVWRTSFYRTPEDL